MIIDAKNLILGRLASTAAKKAMLGDEVIIINSGKAVITGKKTDVLAKYKRKRSSKDALKGPFFPRRPDMFMKRTIRGMLPYKKDKGKTAFKRIRCYIGTPEEFKSQKAVTIKTADISKVPNLKYVTVESVCRELGAKI